MKRSLTKGILAALGVVGCMVWTGCGGGGKGGIAGATDLRYVRTAEQPGVVHLSWNPSLDKKLLGYSVRRRRAGEEGFTLIVSQIVQGTSYTDQLPDPAETRTLTYQVIAVGANGRVSAPAQVTALIAPPAPPGGF